MIALAGNKVDLVKEGAAAEASATTAAADDDEADDGTGKLQLVFSIGVEERNDLQALSPRKLGQRWVQVTKVLGYPLDSVVVLVWT